jgi:hypothetical protein
VELVLTSDDVMIFKAAIMSNFVLLALSYKSLTTPCKGRSNHVHGWLISICARAPDGGAVRLQFFSGV